MPYVNIKVTGGEQAPTQQQKAELIAGATELLVRVLNKNPASTVVVIEEIPTDNWGLNGKSATERGALQRPSGPAYSGSSLTPILAERER